MVIVSHADIIVSVRQDDAVKFVGNGGIAVSIDADLVAGNVVVGCLDVDPGVPVAGDEVALDIVLNTVAICANLNI